MEFGLLVTSDENIAVFLAGLHTKVIIIITFFFILTNLIFSEQKNTLPLFTRKFVIPTYLILSLVMIVSQLGPIETRASHIVYDDGLWKYVYNKESWTYPYFMFWLFISVSITIAVFFKMYFIKLKQNAIANKIFLLFAFVIAPVFLISRFGYSVNETSKGIHVLSPALIISILALVYVYSNYQLFQISPFKAFNKIMEAINNQVFITDNDFNITYLNQTASDTFRIKNAKEHIKQPLKEILQLDDSGWQNLFEKISTSNNLSSFEQEILILNGDQKHYFSLSYSEVFNKRKQKIGYAFVATDITKSRADKEELEAFANQLSEKNIALERFAYIASHDLKTPIRNIISFLGLMKRRLSPTEFEKVEEYFNFVNLNAHNLHQLVNDVLEYSRLTNREQLKIEAIDFHQIVINSMKAIGDSFLEKTAVVECNELPTNLMGDHIKLTQLFQNLFENSLKYNQSKKVKITVNYQLANGYHQFSVKDNGIGIAPEYQEQIFEMFKRLHTVDEYHGTGIGLATCKRIVEMHQGKIWLENDVDEGATFVLTVKVA